MVCMRDETRVVSSCREMPEPFDQNVNWRCDADLIYLTLYTKTNKNDLRTVG